MDRMVWQGKLEFLFACFGYSIGLGNIWRFPYRCYVNGGGAFLFPYFIATIFCTFPLLLLEMLLGQFASEGPVTIWRFCPIFQGVGWAILFNVFITNICYSVLVMYAMFYMLVSFVNIGRPLPWQHCETGDETNWNTKTCREEPFPDFDAIDNDLDKNTAYTNLLDGQCFDTLKNNVSTVLMTFLEFQDKFKECEIKYTSPEEEYWNRFVLEVYKSEGVNDLGSVIGRNLLSLLLVWLIVYYCCVKGVRNLSKVGVYVFFCFCKLSSMLLVVVHTCTYICPICEGSVHISFICLHA